MHYIFGFGICLIGCAVPWVADKIAKGTAQRFVRTPSARSAG
jgi:hypothetical protein